MGTSTQWRLLITDLGGTGITKIAEVQFREVVGVSQVFSGGTASASSSSLGGSGAAAPTDGNIATWWGNSVAVSAGSPQWWQYAFGSAKSIVEYTITMFAGTGSVPPVALSLQSYDGSTWVTEDSRNGLAWSDGETKTFRVGSGVTAQVSQITVETIRSPIPKAQVSQVVIEVIRSNGVQGPTPYTKQFIESLEFAYNGQPFMQAGPSDLDGSGLDYAFNGQPFLFTPDDAVVVVEPPVARRRRLQQFLLMG